MWPHPSPRAAFAERRARLDARLPGPKLFVAGLSRPRNFAKNPYPFRAESHFLYFAGASLEGASLLVDGDRTTLYVTPGVGFSGVPHRMGEGTAAEVAVVTLRAA